MGDLAKGENNPIRKINNRRDSKGSDGDYGMVECRRNKGTEEYLPIHRGKCSSGFPPFGGRSVDHHTKSVLAFSNGSAKIPTLDLPATRESILATLLQKIFDCLGGNPFGSGDFTKENSVQAKLAGWKTNCLSQAGRLVLLKATVTPIAEYYMQCYKLPIRIYDELTSFLGTSLGALMRKKRRLHLVGWDKVTASICLGGLGIFQAKAQNSTILAMRCWRIASSPNVAKA
nr:putative ribonuclease h protein [Quercus suber]